VDTGSFTYILGKGITDLVMQDFYLENLEINLIKR
jgi:hypothetical protein